MQQQHPQILPKIILSHIHCFSFHEAGAGLSIAPYLYLLKGSINFLSIYISVHLFNYLPDDSSVMLTVSIYIRAVASVTLIVLFWQRCEEENKNRTKWLMRCRKRSRTIALPPSTPASPTRTRPGTAGPTT